MRVRVQASQHRWRITTNTGFTLGWWALTQAGLRRAIQANLRACGHHLDTRTSQVVIDLARRHGYVELDAAREGGT